MNQRKLGAIIVLTIALVAPAMILGGYVANALETPHYHHHHMESLVIKNEQIHENPTNLNTSITILNCGGQDIPVNTVKLGEIAQSGSPGVAISVNGTYVDASAGPIFTIKNGDSAVVNMFVSYTSFPYALSKLHSDSVVSITVSTDRAMYYRECNCTKVN